MENGAEHTRRAPLDLTHHFSRAARNRHPSSIKDFYKFFSIPGIGNLAGGTSGSSHTHSDILFLTSIIRTTQSNILPI